MEPQSPTAKRILSYFFDNPDSMSDFETVLGWWLEKNEIKWRIAEVKNALSELVSSGWVLTRPIPATKEKSDRELADICTDSSESPVRLIYRMNPSSLDEIERFLQVGEGPND